MPNVAYPKAKKGGSLAFQRNWGKGVGADRSNRL